MGISEGVGTEMRGREEHVPRAFNSLQAFSHAFTSRDEMYTLAPFATNPSDIIRPMPFAPPVTKTTLSSKTVSIQYVWLSGV